MNVLVIGGSGLLGSSTVHEALKRGHTVSVLSRGNNETIPGVRFIVGDIYTMSKLEFENALSNQDAIVYALGLDDRKLLDRPIYGTLHNDHVDICVKVVHYAREFHIRKFVVFGSYFTYFDSLLPELRLSEKHAYIKTRHEQRDAIIKETGHGLETFVLEIPYVIGSLPGKVPPWSFLFNMLAGNGKYALFFLKGGTAAVTAHQIGVAAIGAIEQGTGGTSYPLGGINLTWSDLAGRFFSIWGKEKMLINIYPSIFGIFGFLSSIPIFFRNKSRGLNIAKFAEFQYMDAFIDPEPSMKALGYTHEDYDLALSAMVQEWAKKRK